MLFYMMSNDNESLIIVMFVYHHNNFTQRLRLMEFDEDAYNLLIYLDVFTSYTTEYMPYDAIAVKLYLNPSLSFYQTVLIYYQLHM